jgi:hypothetical protein
MRNEEHEEIQDILPWECIKVEKGTFKMSISKTCEVVSLHEATTIK